MIFETLIGTLLGGAFRLAPGIMALSDKKNERKHELDMFDKQLEADRLRGQMALDQTKVEADLKLAGDEMQAIIEATRAQAVQTGVKWVDAMSSLMRPLITFWWVIVLYTAVMICQFLSLLNHGELPIDAILKIWGPDERAIVASIVSFWFVDRSLRKMR